MFSGPPPLHETEISTALVTWSSSSWRAGPRSHGASWFPYWVGISYCPHLSSYRSRPRSSQNIAAGPRKLRGSRASQALPVPTDLYSQAVSSSADRRTAVGAL